MYAASALLLSHHIEAKTHNGVITQLSMHFVRAGLLDLEHSTTFGVLFDKPIVVITVILPIVTRHW